MRGGHGRAALVGKGVIGYEADDVAARCKQVYSLGAVVAVGCRVIQVVSGSHRDLVGQAVVCWEELLGGIAAVGEDAIIPCCKDLQACSRRALASCDSNARQWSLWGGSCQGLSLPWPET